MAYEYFLKNDLPVLNTSLTIKAGTKCQLIKHEEGNKLAIVRINNNFDVWIEFNDLEEG